jgi:gliding motility-associated-like protein
VWDGPGCFITDSVWVDDLDCNPQIQNVFSPNGDGTNDVWKPFIEGGQIVKVSIFNRWGAMVYGWNEENKYWEGLDFQNTPVAEGVYFYVIEYADYLERIMAKNGHIDLFR